MKKILIIIGIIMAMGGYFGFNAYKTDSPPFGKDTPFEISKISPITVIHASYNTDIYPQGGKRNIAKVGTGHINYKNDIEEFESIDTSFATTTNGWEMKKASYQSIASEYADELISFTDKFKGNHVVVSYSPVCDHIKGQMTEYNQIVYSNACQGYDLIIENYNIGMRKLIRINSNPNKDLVFPFQFNTDGNALKDNSKKVINFSNGKIKNTKILVGDKGTMLHKMKVWDSSEVKQEQAIDVEFYKEGEKFFFKKIIPQAFLDKAVYPVYTDTITTVDAGAGDGRVEKQSAASWSDCINSASGTTADHTGAEATFRADNQAGVDTGYWCSRAFYPYDLRALPASIVVSSATSSFVSNSGADPGGDLSVILGSPAATSSLATSDFSLVATSTEGTDSRINWPLVSWTRYSMVLNSDGMGWIEDASGGWVSFVVASSHDIDNSAPGGRGYANFQFSEQGNANCPSSDCVPHLVIDYTEAVVPVIIKKQQDIIWFE